MGVPYSKRDLEHFTRAFEGKFCCRCGKRTELCPHPYILSTVHDPDLAVRIRARYELGKAFNPDHDTTDYSKE